MGWQTALESLTLWGVDALSDRFENAGRPAPSDPRLTSFEFLLVEERFTSLMIVSLDSYHKGCPYGRVRTWRRARVSLSRVAMA